MMTPLKDTMVGDILARWPDTATVFNRFKMACPGCVMSPFMTLAEACSAYDLPLPDVLSALERAIVAHDADAKEVSR